MDLVRTTEYYRAVIIGLPFLCFNVVFAAAYRSTSKSTIPMIANLISVISNIILNYIFIFTLGMGVLGAGIATTIARGIVTVIYLVLTLFTNKFWVSIPDVYKRQALFITSICLSIYALSTSIFAPDTTSILF